MTIAIAEPRNRIIEAERLIDLARALLNDPREEIVVNYLDHALEAIHIVTRQGSAPNMQSTATRNSGRR